MSWRTDTDRRNAQLVRPPAQGDLFGARPTPAYQRGSVTSAAAADSVRDSAKTQRARVLEALRAAGDAGLTDEQLQERLELVGNAQRPRRIELLQRGVIEDSGARRETRSGRSAVVWRVRR